MLMIFAISTFLLFSATSQALLLFPRDENETLAEEIKELYKKLVFLRTNKFLENLEKEAETRALLTAFSMNEEASKWDPEERDLAREAEQLRNLGRIIREENDEIRSARNHRPAILKRIMEGAVSSPDVDEEALQHYIELFHKNLSNKFKEVYPQFSTELAGAVYHENCPQPVLPVHYFHDRCKLDYPESFSRLFKDLGLSSAIKDPVLGESACSAYICSKFLSIMKKNFPNLSFLPKTKLKNKLMDPEATAKYLKSIEEEVCKALKGNCSGESLKHLLMKIASTELEPKSTVGRNTRKRSLKRLSASPTKLPLTKTVSSIFDIPQTKDDLFNSFNSGPSVCTRISYAMDPFIIALSARPVNPDYLGGGCLQTINSTNPILIWSPTASRSMLASSVPKIFVASLPGEGPFPLSSDEFTSFRLPHRFMGSSICEIEVVQLSDTSFYSVVRTTGGEILNTRVDFDSSESSPLELYKVRHIELPSHSKRDYLPTSVAICPWRIHSNRSSVKSLQWIMAGRSYDPQNHFNSHLAVVELYDAINNQQTWSTRVSLDCEGECIGHLLTNSAAASSRAFTFGKFAEYEFSKKSYPNTFLYQSLLDYCEQVHQPSCGERRLLPRQILFQTELYLRLSHVSSWVRVGFADAPGMLSLTTPKRLLHFDSRVPNTYVQELFNLTSKTVNLRGGRLFNPHETFFHAQPRWYNDTYALLATDYNVLVVDKRMPNHAVLKWSQALRGPPTYAKFLDMGENCSFPAQTALVTASQHPGEISITGINFNKGLDVPPQGVGPSMTNGYLTPILDCPLNRLPGGLVDPHLSEERLNGGIIGCTAHLLSNRAIRGIILTTLGDIFTEDWYFNKPNAQESHENHAGSIRSWCLDFQSSDKKRHPLVNACPLCERGEELETIETSIEQCTAPILNETCAEEFRAGVPSVDFLETVGRIIHRSYREPVTDIPLTEERAIQEKEFRAFLSELPERTVKGS